MSRATIHLSIHNHLIAHGKCQELIKETTRLIAKEGDHMLDAKIFLISLSVNKTFLVNYLLDDFNDGTMEPFRVEQLEQI
jgi:hypothetical protein